MSNASTIGLVVFTASLFAIVGCDGTSAAVEAGTLKLNNHEKIIMAGYTKASGAYNLRNFFDAASLRRAPVANEDSFCDLKATILHSDLVAKGKRDHIPFHQYYQAVTGEMAFANCKGSPVAKTTTTIKDGTIDSAPISYGDFTAIAQECPRAKDYFRYRLNEDRPLEKSDLIRARNICEETRLLEELNR